MNGYAYQAVSRLKRPSRGSTLAAGAITGSRGPSPHRDTPVVPLDRVARNLQGRRGEKPN